jgi:hypothetical protein
MREAGPGAPAGNRRALLAGRRLVRAPALRPRLTGVALPAAVPGAASELPGRGTRTGLPHRGGEERPEEEQNGRGR